MSFEQFTSAERVVQVFGGYVAGEKFKQLPAGKQRRRAIEFLRQKEVLLVRGQRREHAAAGDAGDQELEGTMLQHQGSLAVKRGQLTEAVTLYQQALKRFQAAGDQASMRRTYNSLGVVEGNAGRLAEARAWYEKSRQVAVALKDQPGLGQAAHNLGIVCQLEGEASSLGNLAIIHFHLGELPAAERHAQAAREIDESLGLNDVWKVYDSLSRIAAAHQNPAAAADWAQKRDTRLAEVERLAAGGGVPSQTP